ncbi:hypothetical protein DY000_02054486 [Brassica cretica]|uniref:Uncharacterized protein n=1 Tax=Brassica cretica TaxID=69181 RepID=A0ABQ7A703_BRACR|nr:hypothetical protein DY000_02054486 [Brassica cretica]
MRKSQKEREPTVGTNSPGPEQPAEAVRPIPELVHAREYTPKVPYPIPARATRKDREEMKCRKMLEDLTVRLPLMDAIQMMPSIAEAEHSVENIDADGYAKMLDSARRMGRMMPPHSKQSTNRTRKTNNTPPQRAQQPTFASYPWPREQEDEPINLDDPMLSDFNCEGWDKETSSRYNTLLKAEILPTHFCHAETLVELGIDEDVFKTFVTLRTSSTLTLSTKCLPLPPSAMRTSLLLPTQTAPSHSWLMESIAHCPSTNSTKSMRSRMSREGWQWRKSLPHQTPSGTSSPMGTGTSTEEVHRSRNRRSFDLAESGESD